MGLIYSGETAEKEAEAPYAFIQWKGTDLCADFHCECGAHHHIDAVFVYGVRCTCGAVYAMPACVPLKKVDSLNLPTWEAEATDEQ